MCLVHNIQISYTDIIPNIRPDIISDTDIIPYLGPDIIPDIVNYLLCSRDIYLHLADDRVCCVHTFFHARVMDSVEVAADILHVFQVAKLVRLFKHKLRLQNSYFKAQDFDDIQILSAHFLNKNPQEHFWNKNPQVHFISI